MNKEKLWAFLLQRDPSMAFKQHSPEAARRLFDLTWNVAYEAGCMDMAERKQEITGGSMEEAEVEAVNAIVEDIEKALSAVFGSQKLYATKKANKKKTDQGGE
jgi:hypothetical protein